MAKEETSFKYQADASPTPAATGSIKWAASEYIDHKQGLNWYLALAAGSVGLAALAFLMSHDYFTVAVVIMLGVIVGLFARRTPKQLNYELSADGLKIEQKEYPFGLFKTFSIIQDGVLTSIDFTPIKRYMPPVSAYFDPADQAKIVAVLEQHLPYEERELDSVERLTRRLRF